MHWGLLVRISDDRDGEGAGVARQEADGRAEVRRRGGTVAHVYRENDTSAYKRKRDAHGVLRAVRPELRQAYADLEAGRTDGLMVYDLDRLARDPRDLEDLIDIVEHTGRPAASVTGSLDLSTDHGITMSRVQVAIANKASRDTSRRVKRVHADLADAGRPSGGRRIYGYTADRLHVVEAEAAILRELALRRLAGEGYVALLNDLNARGIPAASGGPWRLSSIRSVLTNRHVAGIRSLHGRETAAGTWPAILDRATWQQLQDRAGEHHPPTRRYLLSGIARCSLCGGGMGGRVIKGALVYRCANPGCMRLSRRVAGLDAYVTGVVLALIADLDLTPRPDPVDPGIAAELAALRGRRAQVVAAFADVAEDDPIVLRQALAKLDARIDSLQARAEAGSRDRLLHQVRGATADRWERLPLDVRRAVIARLARVTVLPTRSGRRAFDPAGVRVESRRPLSARGGSA